MSLTYQTTVNSKNLSAGMLSAKGMRRNRAVDARTYICLPFFAFLRCDGRGWKRLHVLLTEWRSD